MSRETEEQGQPTMFEICTAIAILYFARVTYPDYVVWETGLGGRLDVTNIVSPVVSVITNIGPDHMDILGETLEMVAMEKGGIIKPGVAVVSAVEQPEALKVIEDIAKEKKSTLYLMNRDYRVETVSSELNRQHFHFQGPFRHLNDLIITLNGSHQLKNAAVSLMALEVLRQYNALVIEDEALVEALKLTEWPGRLEMVADNPRILLDGAHNPEGAEMLAKSLHETYKYRKLHFMMGMLSTKHHSGYLRHILPLVDTLIITEPDFLKKMNASELAELAREQLSETGRKVDVIVEPDWRKALALLHQETGADDLGVVSGTLYLISDVRTWMLYKTDSEKGW